MIAWILTVLYLILIAPVQIGLIFSGGYGPPRAAVGAAVWGAGGQINLALRRDAAGQLHLETSFRSKKSNPPEMNPDQMKKALRVLRALIRADHARNLLQKGVHLDTLEGTAAVHTDNAAHTALISALLQALSGCARHARLRIIPSFSSTAALRIKCIVRTRLGILLIACLMGLISYRLSGKKEETAWNIPSDT